LAEEKESTFEFQIKLRQQKDGNSRLFGRYQLCLFVVSECFVSFDWHKLTLCLALFPAAYPHRPKHDKGTNGKCEYHYGKACAA
jgi:hypothetical protein